MFVQNFCGWGDNDYTIPPIGRAGDCHHPPNTTQDYDYLNTDLVYSDIEDWKPLGGTTKLVNCNTWGSLVYNWPGATDVDQKQKVNGIFTGCKICLDLIIIFLLTLIK